LAEPIKAEFALKDWQLGFLTGPAFALFYATLGLPIARLADRHNRISIIALALALWSAMTSLCAMASSFGQLTMARIFVGVGEAGGSPPAASVLADYFGESERATAMGIYSLGPTIGILIGFVAGGWVNQWYGWRAALMTVGLPGLLLAVVIKLSVREPTRSARPGVRVESMAETLRTLYDDHTCRWVTFAAASAGFAVYGVMVWVPLYLIRRFGLTTGEVGTAVGLIAGVAGSFGVFSGGFLADRLALRDRRWVARVPAVTTLLFVPCVILVLKAPTATVAIALLVPAYLVALAYTGPTWAMLQTAAPAHMRAQAAACMLLVVNLIGLGMGPQAIGIASDMLGSAGSTTGLGAAIGAAAAVSLAASLSFEIARRGITRTAAKIEV
jgi:predicted MFS family arabinose efflux permease